MNKSLLRIAFADDDADDHLLFFKAVKSSFRVPAIDCFFNADDFLSYYLKKENPLPHIIFLDKNMPGNFNYECLSRIKSSELLRHIPVIIYSTSNQEREITEAISKGATGFITKPVGFKETIDVLASTIEKFVDAPFERQPDTGSKF